MISRSLPWPRPSLPAAAWIVAIAAAQIASAQCGSSGWSPLGSGLQDAASDVVNAVRTLADGDIAIGGILTTGSGAAKNIAVWNGSDYLPLGPGVNMSVSAIVQLPSGDIVAGGALTATGDSLIALSRIGRWDGSQWNALGSGLNNTVNVLAITPNGDLIAAGAFTATGDGSISLNHIARWDGASWQAIGSGLSSTLNSLTIASNGDIIAGGQFTDRVSRWNGSSWTSMPLTGNPPTALLALPSGDIILGNSTAPGVFHWTGSSWSPLAGGIAMGNTSANQVKSLCALPDGSVVVGGWFGATADGTLTNIGCVARWSPSSGWSSLETGVSGTTTLNVNSMTFDGVNVVVGGSFSNVQGQTTMGRLAKWARCGASCHPTAGCATGTEFGGAIPSGGLFRGQGTICDSCPQFALGGPVVVTDTTGNGNGNGLANPGETDVRLTIPVTNYASTLQTAVIATLTSLTPTVTVVSPGSSYPNIPFNSPQNNVVPFVISVDPAHPCAEPIQLRLSLLADGGATADLDFQVASGYPGGNPSATYNGGTTGTAFADNNPAGANVLFSVAGAGRVDNVQVQFNGTSSSSSATSTSVGLAHGNVGDLVITLTSPSGTTITLVNRPGEDGNGDPSPSLGNNFYQLTFDDSAGYSIQTIPDYAASPTAGPITGYYQPVSPLATFLGESPNGTWTLNVADVIASTGGTANGQGGKVYNVSLLLTTIPDCEAPAAATGICCRGATCSSAVTQGDCTGAGTSGASFALGAASCNAASSTSSPCCYGDYNKVGGITVQDIFDFLADWFSGSRFAAVGSDGSGRPLAVQDIFDFLSAWFAGGC